MVTGHIRKSYADSPQSQRPKESTPTPTVQLTSVGGESYS